MTTSLSKSDDRDGRLSEDATTSHNTNKLADSVEEQQQEEGRRDPRDSPDDDAAASPRDGGNSAFDDKPDPSTLSKPHHLAKTSPNKVKPKEPPSSEYQIVDLDEAETKMEAISVDKEHRDASSIMAGPPSANRSSQQEHPDGDRRLIKQNSATDTAQSEPEHQQDHAASNSNNKEKPDPFLPQYKDQVRRAGFDAAAADCEEVLAASAVIPLDPPASVEEAPMTVLPDYKDQARTASLKGGESISSNIHLAPSVYAVAEENPVIPAAQQTPFPPGINAKNTVGHFDAGSPTAAAAAVAVAAPSLVPISANTNGNSSGSNSTSAEAQLPPTLKLRTRIVWARAFMIVAIAVVIAVVVVVVDRGGNTSEVPTPVPGSLPPTPAPSMLPPTTSPLSLRPTTAPSSTPSSSSMPLSSQTETPSLSPFVFENKLDSGCGSFWEKFGLNEVMCFYTLWIILEIAV